ncbi:MAG: hypothetical protein ACE5QW_08585 [Thermoplasmata archaeon]
MKARGASAALSILPWSGNSTLHEMAEEGEFLWRCSSTNSSAVPDGWMWDWYLKSWIQNSSEEDQAVQIWEGEDLDLDGVIEEDNFLQTGGDYPNETYPLIGDSDDDGIPDNIESYFGLDPLNESDAYEDMDEDYLSNIYEYQHAIDSGDPYIDEDEDHLINFNDTNDDTDLWFTSWEVEWGMDPYGDDTDLDLDGDDLSNFYEWNATERYDREYINLTSADSDGDGLDDGWGLQYWNVTRGIGDEEKALNYTSTYDMDGDGISDGQEYNGYDITIVRIEGDETKSKDRKVYGDPLYAYKDKNNNSLDVDEDGIYDHIEVDPYNITE